VLEVGCANGQDFVRFLADSPARIVGVDVEPYEIDQANFTFVRADAEHLEFPDGHFDVAVSIGVFEHIQPIEKLCRAAAEIRRVSRAFCVIVPSVGTLLEPHAAELFWHLRDHNKKTKRANLNYFSDEAWLKFGAFEGAEVRRFWYLPMLIQCLAIYGCQHESARGESLELTTPCHAG
jgi:SAM-dependent methyltransferase